MMIIMLLYGEEEERRRSDERRDMEEPPPICFVPARRVKKSYPSYPLLTSAPLSVCTVRAMMSS